MTRVSLVRLVLCVTTLSAASPAAGKAEPQVLSVAEMDTVTAAGPVVNVNTFAAALGNYANTTTDVRTLVIDLPWGSVALGWGFGQAVACCGPASAVGVGTSLSGEGDVAQGRASEVRSDNDVLAVAVTTGWVLAISRVLPAAIQPPATGFPQLRGDP
jgi:hypothetical protein